MIRTCGVWRRWVRLKGKGVEMKIFKGILYVIFLLSLCVVTNGCGSSKKDNMAMAKRNIEIGRYGNAKADLETEIKEHPKNAEAYYLLGRIFLLNSWADYSLAEPRFESAYKINKSYAKQIAELYSQYLKQAKGLNVSDAEINNEQNPAKKETLMKKKERYEHAKTMHQMWLARTAADNSKE